MGIICAGASFTWTGVGAWSNVCFIACDYCVFPYSSAASNNKETKKLVHLLEWTIMYYVVIVINSIA